MTSDETNLSVHGPTVALGGTTAPGEVLVFDGDPVVGQALVLLLEGSGRNVKFLDKSSLKRLGTLEGVRVILFAPGWSAEGRRAVSAMIGNSTPATRRRIWVLEMGTPPEGIQVEPEHYLPWPCRMEDLKKRVDALLTDKPEGA